MNLTKERIEDWIEKAVCSDAVNSVTEFATDDFIQRPRGYMKRFLVDMKVQIDRWDLVTEYVAIHPATMKFFEIYLGPDLEKKNLVNPRNSIWGQEFVENIHVPNDTLISFSTHFLDDNLEFDHDKFPDHEDEGQYIALGKIDCNIIERLNNMKVFW